MSFISYPHFGTLSSFGKKELIAKQVGHSDNFGTLSSFGKKEPASLLLVIGCLLWYSIILW